LCNIVFFDILISFTAYTANFLEICSAVFTVIFEEINAAYPRKVYVFVRLMVMVNIKYGNIDKKKYFWGCKPLDKNLAAHHFKTSNFN
jgi:hypothetical protein